jgi:deoxyribodipyrimidine photo-lyase
VELANELERPLLVFEAVRAGYRWASLRHHAFLLRGMHDNAAACAKAGVSYYPWVEPAPGAGKGLLAALGARACAVVADEWPCFFLPRAIEAAAKACEARFELVDSIGLLPIRAAGSCFLRAYDFRRFLQRELAPHLARLPQSDPLARLGRHGKDAQPPASVLRRWPRTPPTWLDAPAQHCRVDGLDPAVPPAPTIGGSVQGAQRLGQFLEQRLSRYAEERSDMDDSAASGLSPYLHYGHVGTHQVFASSFATSAGSPRSWPARRAAARRAGGG